MNVAYWLSRRLSMRGAEKNNSITGVVIAVVGVALSLIIMMFTIAIVLGFKQQITSKLMGFDAQISISPAYDPLTERCENMLSANDTLLNAIKQYLPEAELTLAFKEPGILKTDDNFSAVIFNGFDHNYKASFERGNIVDGEFPDYSNPDNANKIVISSAVAADLKLKPGDKLFSCFFVNDNIKTRKHEVAGIFESNFADYDKITAYASIDALRKIAAVDSLSCTHIQLRGLPIDSITTAAENLQQGLINDYYNGTLGNIYPVQNIVETGAMYFNWLQLLDTNVVVILILMLCVAAFTLVSSMFIIILEHIPTIGILRAMGATRRTVRRIFINMAMKVVFYGMLVGNILGIGMLWLQSEYRIVKLDPDMYFLKHVPVCIDWWAIILLNIGIVIATWLILVLPSHLASTISPAKTVRYE